MQINFQTEFHELFNLTFQDTFSKTSAKQNSKDPEIFVKQFSETYSESFLFSFSKAYSRLNGEQVSVEIKTNQIPKETKMNSGSTSSPLKDRIKLKNSSRHSFSLDELTKTPESQELRKSLSSHFHRPTADGREGIKKALNLFPMFKENNESKSSKVTTSPVPSDEISGMFQMGDSFGDCLKMFSEFENKNETTNIVHNFKVEEKKKDIFSSKYF
jgi:hypothetical protein